MSAEGTATVCSGLALNIQSVESQLELSIDDDQVLDTVITGLLSSVIVGRGTPADFRVVQGSTWRNKE